MAQIYGERLKCLKYRYVANDLIILNMASMCGKRLKFRNVITMLEMTEEFEKRLIYLRNDVHMWKMA